MKYWLLLLPLTLFSCASETPEELTHSCSSIQTMDNRTILNNAFYQVLDNGTILSISEEEVLGDSLGVNKLHVANFETEGASSTWAIDLSNIDYLIEQNTLIAHWQANGYYDDSYSAYSLFTGEKLLDYTYDKLEILFNHPDEKRFFGFYSDNGIPIEAYSKVQKKGTFGVLAYANQNEEIKRLRLTAADPMWEDLLDVSNPVFELVPVTEGTIALNSGKSLFFTSQSAAEKGGVNFDIRIIFYTTDSYKPVEFTLQVRNDELLVPSHFEHSVFALESL